MGYKLSLEQIFFLRSIESLSEVKREKLNVTIIPKTTRPKVLIDKRYIRVDEEGGISLRQRGGYLLDKLRGYYEDREVLTFKPTGKKDGENIMIKTSA